MSAIFDSKFIKVFTPTSSLLTGLRGYWKLDETGGTTVSDSVSTNHGTLVGALPDQATSKLGRAVLFDGTNDYMTLPNGAQPTGTSFAISMWFNLNNTPAVADYLFNFKTTDDGDNRTRFYIDTANKLNGFVYDSALGFVDIFYNTAVSLDTYYHLVVNVLGNGLAVKTWLGGSLVNTSANLANTPGSFNGVIVFGDSSFSGNWRAFDGFMDEIGIWDRSLTDVEIGVLYNSNNGKTHPFI